MKVGERQGKDVGGIGNNRPCWVVDRSPGGVRAGWPRLRLVCAFDGGGPERNIPFPHPKFKSRGCLSFHLDPVEKSGVGLVVPGWVSSVPGQWGNGAMAGTAYRHSPQAPVNLVLLS